MIGKLVLDPDERAWTAAVRAAGGTVSAAQEARVSNLIRSLKVDGVWSSLDRLWLFAAENATQALIDLKARSTATAVNSPTFTANRGYASNGTTSYVNTNYNPTSGTNNFVRDDANMGVWVETSATGTTDKYYLSNDAINFGFIGQQTGTAYFAGVNSAGPITFTHGGGTTGLWHAQRTGANAIELFRAGVSVATDTDASVAIPNNSFFALAANAAGTPGNFADARVAAAYMGKSLTSGQVTALYNALRTYMTAVGVA